MVEPVSIMSSTTIQSFPATSPEIFRNLSTMRWVRRSSSGVSSSTWTMSAERSSLSRQTETFLDRVGDLWVWFKDFLCLNFDIIMSKYVLTITTPVMYHSKLQSKIIRHPDRPLGSSFIRRHDNTVLPVRDVVLDPVTEQWLHLCQEHQSWSEDEALTTNLETVHWVVKESF